MSLLIYFKTKAKLKYVDIGGGFKACGQTNTIKKNSIYLEGILKCGSHEKFMKSIKVDKMGLLDSIDKMSLSFEFFEYKEDNEEFNLKIKKVLRAEKLRKISDNL